MPVSPLPPSYRHCSLFHFSRFHALPRVSFFLRLSAFFHALFNSQFLFQFLINLFLPCSPSLSTHRLLISYVLSFRTRGDELYMQSNKIHNVVLMSKFYSALMLARHVSDLIGPSSGAVCTSCICGLWYVIIRVLLDTSGRYKAVGIAHSLKNFVYLVGLHIYYKMIHGSYHNKVMN